MRSILTILIGLVLCGSACAEAPTSGMLARYFGPGSTYGASTSVADVAGGDFVDTESADGILAIPGADLSGKSSSTLSFTFQSTDTVGVIFSRGIAASPYLLLFSQFSSDTNLHSGSGTITVTVDGTPFTGGRDDFQSIACDGDAHEVVLSGVDFTANAAWAANGLYVGGYDTGLFNLTGTVSNLTLDGHAYTNGNRGTLQGGDTLATLHVGTGNGPGGNLANHGVVLDGSADYVNIPHATALNAYPITVAFWAKTTTNDASVRGAFVKYQSGSGNGWSTHLANGTLYGWYWGATSGNRVYGSGNGVSAGAMNDGEWHHWTMVVDASGMTWYKDGAAVGAPTAWTGTPQASSSTFAMQVGQYSTFKFPGSIADAIVYNRALSLSEVGQVYAEGVDAPSALIRLRGIGGKLQTINGSPVGVSQ